MSPQALYLTVRDLFSVTGMDVAGRRFGLDQQPRHRFGGRGRAGAVEPRIGGVAGIEGTIESLLPVLIRLVEPDEVAEFGAPVGAARSAQRIEKIEAAQDFGEMFHLRLI